MIHNQKYKTKWRSLILTSAISSPKDFPTNILINQVEIANYKIQGMITTPLTTHRSITHQLH